MCRYMIHINTFCLKRNALPNSGLARKQLIIHTSSKNLQNLLLSIAFSMGTLKGKKFFPLRAAPRIKEENIFYVR